MLFYILIFVILSIFTVESKEVVNLRYLSKSGDLNDNNKLLKLLETKDNIILKESLKIELESWKSIDIESKSIIGGGDDIKISLCIGKSGSIRFLNKIKDSEIFNITIELDISDNNEIKNGLINKIDNSKITKFHVIIEDNIKLNGNENGLNGLISNEIVNSEINDMGIIFNEMEIEYVQGVMWCLLSCNILNQEVKYYNGLFLKGKWLILEPKSSVINIGLLIYSSTNTNYNYVVIDIYILKFHAFSVFCFSLFIDKSTSSLELNNVMIVVRNKLLYEDISPNLNKMMVLSGLTNEMGYYKTLKLNHYLFDIHVDDIKMEFKEPVKDNAKRTFTINGISDRNYGNVFANYIQIKFYFQKFYKTKKNKLCYIGLNGIHYCKAVMEASLLFTSNLANNISVSNSYFYIKKESYQDVTTIHIIPLDIGLSNVSYHNCFITDKDELVQDKSNLIDDSIFDIYSRMKHLNYSRNESIIYDSSMPYYNYYTDDIDYDIFLKITKNRKNKSVGENENSKNKSFKYIYIIVTLILMISVAVYYFKNNYNDYSIVNVNDRG